MKKALFFMVITLIITVLLVCMAFISSMIMPNLKVVGTAYLVFNLIAIYFDWHKRLWVDFIENRSINSDGF